VEWLVALIAIVEVVLLMEISNRLARAVHQRLPLPHLFSHCVAPWILGGFDGTRVVMYHQSSGMLIQVLKRLSARRTDAVASLGVAKTQLPKGKAYEPSKGWRLPIKRLPYACVIVWRWRLPSPYRDGEEMARIDCGASLARVKEALAKLTSEDPRIGEDPTFYVWLENGAARRVMGRFEDEGSLT